MKKIIVAALLFGYSTRAIGQQKVADPTLQNLTKLDIGLGGAGITLQKKLAKNFLIDLSAGVGGGYDVSEDAVMYEWNLLLPAFYASATPKLYFNRQRRINKKKSILNNAGDYFGIRFKATTGSVAPNDYLRPAMLMNLHWGLQRPLGSRWTINTHAGIGYATDINSGFGSIYPALDLKFSYLLNRR